MDYLSGYRGGILLISHDLPLLDAAITTVLELDGGKLESYRGNYSGFLVERARRREQRERERRHQDEAIERLEFNIRRFKGTTEKMSKVARAMETRVDRMKRDLVEVQRRGKSVAVRFPQPKPSGVTPLTGAGLAKSFGDNLVFVDVDVDVNRGEKLLILGLNGAGKTTLLRILAGVETADLGEVSLGHNATLGYYAQEHEQIHSGVTVLDHLRQVSDQPDQMLRTMLGHFLLADKIDQDAATLSGGEKTKLALAMVVLGGPNVLLLDEPTNNLGVAETQGVLRFVREVRDMGHSCIFIAHNIHHVFQVVDRMVVMRRGTVVAGDLDPRTSTIQDVEDVITGEQVAI